MLKEIIQSWAISFNPTKEQKEKAEQRLAICKSCENKSDGLIEVCKICGCPLKGKVFTSIKGCPIRKW